MTVDLSKIKAGDKVHLEVEVLEYNKNLYFALSQNMSEDRRVLDPNNLCWYNEATFTIVKHLPKPWEPKVGDRIIGINNPKVAGTIIHIDEDGDWMIKGCGPYNKCVLSKTNHPYYKLDNS